MVVKRMHRECRASSICGGAFSLSLSQIGSAVWLCARGFGATVRLHRFRATLIACCCQLVGRRLPVRGWSWCPCFVGGGGSGSLLGCCLVRFGGWVPNLVVELELKGAGLGLARCLAPCA